MRWRITGSSATPALAGQLAQLVERDPRRPARRAAPRPARSFISVVIATLQPLPTPPTTFSSGIRASSMKSSLNSGLAGDLAQRADLHAVLLHVHDEVGEALVLGRVRVGARDEHAPLGLVRERGPDLLAGDDASSPFALTALVFSDARSEPDSGSEKPWHQISSPERIGSRKRSFCSSVPWAITIGPAHDQPEHVGRRGRAWRAPSPRRRSPARSASRRGRRTPSATRRRPSRRRAACAATRAGTRTACVVARRAPRPGGCPRASARSSSRNACLGGRERQVHGR